jgi:hypothetical protein
MGAACHAQLLCAPVARIHLLDAALANQIAAAAAAGRRRLRFGHGAFA